MASSSNSNPNPDPEINPASLVEPDTKPQAPPLKLPDISPEVLKMVPRVLMLQKLAAKLKEAREKDPQNPRRNVALKMLPRVIMLHNLKQKKLLEENVNPGPEIVVNPSPVPAEDATEAPALAEGGGEDVTEGGGEDVTEGGGEDVEEPPLLAKGVEGLTEVAKAVEDETELPEGTEDEELDEFIDELRCVWETTKGSPKKLNHFVQMRVSSLPSEERERYMKAVDDKVAEWLN